MTGLEVHSSKAGLRSRIPAVFLRDGAILLLFALVSVTWFRSAEMFATPDSNFPLDIPSTIGRYFEVWDYRSVPGQTDARKFAYVVPWALLLKVWSSASLPFDPGVFQRALVFGLLLASELSAYALFSVLARPLFPRPVGLRGGGILAGFLYGFNFYSMLTIWSTLAFLMFAYAFLPLVIALVLRGVERGWGTRHAAAIALLWTATLSPAYITTPVAITDWSSVWLVVIVAAVASGAVRQWRTNGFGFVARIAIFWIAFNFHWLLIDATIGTAEFARYASDTNLFAWNAAPLSDAFRLAGYQGLGDYYRDSPLFPWAAWYGNPWILVLGYVPAAFALIGLAWRRTPTTLGIAVLLTTMLFLVKGPLPPFGFVNDFVFPSGFLATTFRSTYQRFMGYAALAIAMLAPIGAVELARRMAQVRPRRTTATRPTQVRRSTAAGMIVVVLILVSATYVAPLLSGAIYENEGAIPSYRVTLPPSWVELAEWLDAQGGTFSVLPLPYSITSAITTLRFSNGSEGYLSLYPLILLSSRPIAMGRGPGADLALLLARGILADAQSLNMLNVRFVLAHLDANMVDLEGSPHYVMTRPSVLLPALNATPGLEFRGSFGATWVYENMRWSNTELVWLPDSAEARYPHPAFLWNSIAQPVSRWDTVEFAGSPVYGDHIVSISLAPSLPADNGTVHFGLSLWERPDLTEGGLPFWIEYSPAGAPTRAWTRYNRVAEDQNVSVYASNHALSVEEPSRIFESLFDSFESGSIQHWSEMTGSWAISTGVAVDGFASVVGGPTPGTLTKDLELSSGVFEGWFRFGEDTVRHYPFIAMDSSGALNLWAVALETGYWGHYNGVDYTPYPVYKAYTPNSWVSLRVEFNFTLGLFWTYVDGELLTPEGLSTTNDRGLSGDFITKVRLQNAPEDAAGTMWADALRMRPGTLPQVNLALVNRRSLLLNPQPLPHELVVDSMSEFRSNADMSPGMTLVLLRTYHPGWLIEINGAPLPESAHFVAFGAWNGWRLEENGPATIRIRFAPQSTWETTFWISGAAIIVGLLILPLKRRTLNPKGAATTSARPTLLVVSPALVGGSWLLINELAGRLRDRMDVVVAAVGPSSRKLPGSKCYRLPWLDYEVYGVNIDRSLIGLLWFEVPLVALGLIVWARHRPAVWLGNGLLSGALGIVPQKIIGGRVVVSYNAYMGADAETEARRGLARRITRHISMVLVNSRGSFADAQALAPTEKILILPHSADEVFFEDGDPSALRKEFGLDGHEVVLFVGRLDREKHCDFLLRVAEVANPRFRFVFVGNGPLADEIQDRAESNANVIYVGRVTDRARLRDVYQMADLVWTYADETYLAKPAVEALASGTPILVADLPAIAAKAARNAKIDPALVPRDIGWLVELESPAKVARLIEEIDLGPEAQVERRRRCRQHAMDLYSPRNADIAVAGILSLVDIPETHDVGETRDRSARDDPRIG